MTCGFINNCALLCTCMWYESRTQIIVYPIEIIVVIFDKCDFGHEFGHDLFFCYLLYWVSQKQYPYYVTILIHFDLNSKFLQWHTIEYTNVMLN